MFGKKAIVPLVLILISLVLFVFNLFEFKNGNRAIWGMVSNVLLIDHKFFDISLSYPDMLTKYPSPPIGGRLPSAPLHFLRLFSFWELRGPPREGVRAPENPGFMN